MNALVLEKLQVVVTGVDAAIARDVARLVAGEGASVIAADRDLARLARLERDLGLYRTRIETAQVDLGSHAEVRLWEESLAAFGRLPHVMICCCGLPAPRTAAAGAPPKSEPRRGGQPDDVALTEGRRPRCPATIAERVLQPTLFLHAEPTRRTVFDRALAVLRHPTLRGLLGRAPGRSVFSPEQQIPYVRIASQLYSLRRHASGDAPTGRRIRLIPPNDTPPRQADAA
ncbi:MAG TPA: SDR family NAD(P)-dependent oxidoreductase [Caulobacteraceae bacterium]|nr:SDR family NAD(P)-dependent oxidoreductase [Caulobacteraceae bacterium]